MKHFLVGIAGGSGSGKSTLAQELKKRYPDLIEVVHFDDYQKEEVDIPFLEGMRNWDHPDAIDFKRLHLDLIQLKEGNAVTIMTESSAVNPDYEKNGRIVYILKPMKIIIVEGYLALYDRKIRELFDFRIFLDIPVEKSIERRDKITYNDESEYNRKILIPMHKKYVEPAEKTADLIVDVSRNKKERVYELVLDKLRELRILII